ncbi:MAG: hypothetical protein ACLP2Y_00110 [Limisphaerales bacterium]
MKELLSKLFPTWVYWMAFIFTMAGVFYSIGENMPWMCSLVLVPLLLAMFDVSIRSHWQNKRLRTETELANVQRAESDRKLQQLSADKLLYLEELVSRGAFEQYFDLIHEASTYIGRLQKLSAIEFNLRTIHITGEKLYVAAKMPIEALSQLKENDHFVMSVKRNGMNHKIAKLRLHQVNEEEESIFFEVSEAFDNTMLNSLRDLTQAGGINVLEDYSILPDVDIAPFQGQDMQSVANALKILKEKQKNN